mmetsp:Transcript_82454/g.214845  ORF Transcript_82454/g.214845 Transcript_82454/m.214845 type:complete len:260 (-) Transcript_82454:99-878(-)
MSPGGAIESGGNCGAALTAEDAGVEADNAFPCAEVGDVAPVAAEEVAPVRLAARCGERWFTCDADDASSRGVRPGVGAELVPGEPTVKVRSDFLVAPPPTTAALGAPSGEPRLLASPAAEAELDSPVERLAEGSAEAVAGVAPCVWLAAAVTGPIGGTKPSPRRSRRTLCGLPGPVAAGTGALLPNATAVEDGLAVFGAEPAALRPAPLPDTAVDDDGAASAADPDATAAIGDGDVDVDCGTSSREPRRPAMRSKTPNC